METNVSKKCKAFTSLEQSRKLANILPTESADMYYWCADHYPKEDWIIEVGEPDNNYECVYAWSLAAMLERFKDTAGLARDFGLWFCYYNRKLYSTKHYDNPIDACYEMILKLHECELL